MKRSNLALIKDSGVGEMVHGAFEYWTLAQMAEETGRPEDLKIYQPWIDDWGKYYDPKKQLLSGKWVEANDWQGTFGVSHDIPGLAALMGGPDALAAKLNSAFEQAAPDDFVFGYGGHDEDQGQMCGVSALMKIGRFSLCETSSKEPVYEITTRHRAHLVRTALFPRGSSAGPATSDIARPLPVSDFRHHPD